MVRLLILILLLGLLFIIYWYYDKVLIGESTEPKMIAPNPEMVRRTDNRNERDRNGRGDRGRTSKINKGKSGKKSKSYKGIKNLSFIDPETEESNQSGSYCDENSNATYDSSELMFDSADNQSCQSQGTSRSDDFSLSDLDNRNSI